MTAVKKVSMQNYSAQLYLIAWFLAYPHS